MTDYSYRTNDKYKKVTLKEFKKAVTAETRPLYSLAQVNEELSKGKTVYFVEVLYPSLYSM